MINFVKLSPNFQNPQHWGEIKCIFFKMYTKKKTLNPKTKRTQNSSFEDLGPSLKSFCHILLKKKDPANTWLEVGTHTPSHTPPPTKEFV